jgi:hypothetical protein
VTFEGSGLREISSRIRIKIWMCGEGRRIKCGLTEKAG